MGARVAEQLVRRGRFRPPVRLRVDLHGVSVFGPGDRHTVVRWEWIDEIVAGEGVTVRSANAQIDLPPGAFGLDSEHLADQLRAARSIDRRPDVIEALSHSR